MGDALLGDTARAILYIPYKWKGTNKTLTWICLRSATSGRNKSLSEWGTGWTRKEDWQSAYLYVYFQSRRACITCTHIQSTIFRNTFERVRELRFEQLYAADLLSFDNEMIERKNDSYSTPYTFNLLVLVALTLVALHWEMADWRMVSEFPIIIYWDFSIDSESGFTIRTMQIQNLTDDKIRRDEFWALFLPYCFESHVSIRRRARSCLLWNIFRLAARFIGTATISHVLSLYFIHPCRRWFFPSCMRESFAWGGEARRNHEWYVYDISSHGWIDMDF